jgi:hypothetical protein
MTALAFPPRRQAGTKCSLGYNVFFASCIGGGFGLKIKYVTADVDRRLGYPEIAPPSTGWEAWGNSPLHYRLPGHRPVIASIGNSNCGCTPVRHAHRSKEQHSALSNKTQLFLEPVDRRTAFSRRFSDLLQDFVRHNGGWDYISAARLWRQASAPPANGKVSRNSCTHS